MGTVSGVGIAETFPGCYTRSLVLAMCSLLLCGRGGSCSTLGSVFPKLLVPWGIWDETVCSRCWGSQPPKAQQS